MRSAVWRVAGRDFDVEAFVDRFGLRERIDRIWKAGEKDELDLRLEERTGPRPAPDRSGFNYAIADEDQPGHPALEDALVQFASDVRDAARELRDRGIASEVDVGVTVGGERLTASVAVGPAVLLALAKAGIGFRVSAYGSRGEPSHAGRR